MALRNAFDNLGTEAALRRIANLLTFARDVNDRIRVVVDNQPAFTIYNRNSSSSIQNSTQAYNDPSSWNNIDARDTLKQQYRMNTANVAKNRWTY